MQILQTKLSGVLIITPKRFGDARGFFSESWSRRTLQDNGIDLDFVQDNHSLSSAVGTVRGLHCQAPPYAQDKLVRCARGALMDVVVDIRHGSATYGQSVCIDLTEEDGKQILVPKGFLHGFVTRRPDTEIAYKCTDYYNQSYEQTVQWNDPDLGIEWGVALEDATLSARDAAATPFDQLAPYFTYAT